LIFEQIGQGVESQGSKNLPKIACYHYSGQSFDSNELELCV